MSLLTARSIRPRALLRQGALAFALTTALGAGFYAPAALADAPQPAVTSPSKASTAKATVDLRIIHYPLSRSVLGMHVAAASHVAPDAACAREEHRRHGSIPTRSSRIAGARQKHFLGERRDQVRGRGSLPPRVTHSASSVSRCRSARRPLAPERRPSSCSESVVYGLGR